MHDIAQMLMMAAGGQAGVVSVYDGGAASADVATLTSFTSAALAIGTAASSRLVVAMIGVIDGALGGAVDPSSVTIGGVSASKVGGVTSGYLNWSMWVAVVPSGTTAAVSATFSRTIQAYTTKVYALTGAIATPAYTYVYSAPALASIGVVRNGAVLAMTIAVSDPRMNGAGGLLLDPTGNNSFTATPSGASVPLFHGTATTPLSETLTGTPNPSYQQCVIASFAPM